MAPTRALATETIRLLIKPVTTFGSVSTLNFESVNPSGPTKAP